MRRVDRGQIIDGIKIEGTGVCLEAWELPKELEEGERLLGNLRGYQEGIWRLLGNIRGLIIIIL